MMNRLRKWLEKRKPFATLEESIASVKENEILEVIEVINITYRVGLNKIIKTNPSTKEIILDSINTKSIDSKEIINYVWYYRGKRYNKEDQKEDDSLDQEIFRTIEVN